MEIRLPPHTAETYEQMSSAELLKLHAELKGADLAHVTRAVWQRHADGELADGTVSAAHVQRLVDRGTLPTRDETKAHLDGNEGRRKSATPKTS